MYQRSALHFAAVRAYQRLATEHPVRYAQAVLGLKLWKKQKEIMRLIADPDVPYVAVRSGNAVGKTYVTAAAVCHYLDTHAPGYAVLSSSSWTQLLKTAWPVLRKVVRDAPVELGGEVMATEWRRGEHWGAFCASPDRPENFAGFRTSRGCMVVVDEASALDVHVHDAIMGLCAAAGSKVLYLGNPLRPEGPFYDVFHSSEWATVHVSSYEVVDLGIPGLATREWIETRKREWGEDSPMFQARVLGEFPESASDGLIKLAWLDGLIVPGDGGNIPRRGAMRLGVDVARYGDDRTVLVVRDDAAVRDVTVTRGASLMQTVGMVQEVMRKWSIDEDAVFVDDTGLGGGVTDRLEELDVVVNGVNFGARATDHDRFVNARTEMYWLMREACSPEVGDRRLRIPARFAALAKELTWPHYSLQSDRRITLEAKDKIKERRRRSPDLADALALTFSPEGGGFGVEAA